MNRITALLDSVLPWLRADKPQPEPLAEPVPPPEEEPVFPNYLGVEPMLDRGADRVRTDCIRNDQMMAVRLWVKPKNIEAIMCMQQPSPNGVTPIEVTVAMPRDKDDLTSDPIYIMLTGAMVVAAYCGREEFEKLKEHAKMGGGLPTDDLLKCGGDAGKLIELLENKETDKSFN